MMDIVTGDTITWTEPVFYDNFRNPRYVGDREISGTIVRDSYGPKTGQHTFTILVTASTGIDPVDPGTKIQRKGRNLYGRITDYTYGDQHEANAQDKHRRAETQAARNRAVYP